MGGGECRSEEEESVEGVGDCKLFPQTVFKFSVTQPYFKKALDM